MKEQKGYYSSGLWLVGWAGAVFFGLVVFFLALVGEPALALDKVITSDVEISGESNDEYYVNGSTVDGTGFSEKLGYPTDGIIVSGGKTGLTSADNASNNNITVIGLNITDANITVIGGVNVKNDTGSRNNNVTITNDVLIGTIGTNGSVFGGLSNITNAIVEKNKVNITNGKVGLDVSGGVAINGTAQHNIVIIEQGEVGRTIYGGAADNGTAFNNTVKINGGTIGGIVMGGSGAQASNNTININNSIVGSYVVGGRGVGFESLPSKAIYIENNTVTIEGGSNISDVVYGGFLDHVSSGDNATNGSIRNNTVIINNLNGEIGNSSIADGAWGIVAAGYANDNTSGTISGNKVDFQAGSVVHTVAGGYARGNSSDVLNNNVTISGGTIGKANGPGRVAGGYIYGRSDPSSGDLRDNRVDFSGGQAYSVYGGYIDSKGTGNVSGNKVFVSGGQIGGASANPGDVGTVAGASVGANSLGNLTNNTVNFTDGEAKLVIGAVAGFKAANNLSSNRVDILGGNASNVIGGSTGENFSGNVTYNIVNISGANVSGNITGGFVGANSTGSFVSNNTVYFSSPYNATKIVGGFVGNNSDEIISYNQVIIVDGNVTEGVVGGFASKGVADNNTLDITNSHFGSAYGGYSINASASGNKITLTNVIVDYNVTGGASDNSSVNSNSNNSVILRGAEIGGSIVGTKGANNSVTFESGTNKINGTVDISGNLLIKTDTVNTVNQSAKVGNLTIEGGQNVFENGATVANNVTIQSGDNQFLGDLVITAGDLKASAGDNTFANITLSAGNITFSGAGNNVYTGNITSTNLSFAGGAHNFQSQLDITTTNDVVASGDSHLYLGEGADIAFTKSLIINSQLTLRSDARLAVVGDTGLGVVGTLDLGENLLNVDGNATFYDKASFIFDSSSTAQGALRATGDIGVNRTTDIVKVTPLSAINVNTSLPIMYTDSTGTISLDEETNLVSDYFVFHKSSDTSGANITVEFKQFDEIVDNIIANLDTDLTPNQAELVNLAKKMEASLDVNDDAKVLLVSLIDRFIKAAATNDSSIVDRLFRESNGEFLVNAYTAALESAIKTQGVVFKRLDQIHDSLAPTPPAAGSADAFNRVWVGGFGSWARQKNREGIFGYDYNSGGFSLGYDRRAEGTPGLGFGVVTSFSFGKIDSNSGVSTVDVDTAGVGLYGSYLLDNGLFLDANFAYAHSKNESKVFTIGGGHKRGDFGVDTWQIGTRLGKIFDLGNIKLTPTLGLRYLSVDQEAFRERVVNTTTAFINYVPKKKDHIFEIPVLLKLNGAFETGTTKIIPEFRVGYTFVPQRPDSELKVGILGFSEGLMTINGIKPARGSVQVGLGAKFEINDQFDVFVNYDLDAAKKFVNHNAAIGIGFNF